MYLKVWPVVGKVVRVGFMVFKLHLVINNLGEIINLKLTSGNVHDVAILESLTQELKGSYSETKAI